MQPIQRILCVSDGTHADTPALEQALSQARHHVAQLDVQVLCPPLPDEFGRYNAAYESGLKEQLQQRLAAVGQRLKDAPPLHNIKITATHAPARYLVAAVLEGSYQLLIKAPAPHTNARGKTLQGFAAVDMELLRLCPCPVWLSRPIVRPREEMVVAVAVEANSEDATRRALALQILQFGKSLADQCNGELQVISCWDYPFEDYLRFSPWSRLEDNEIQSVVAQAHQVQRNTLQELIQAAGIGINVKRHFPRGSADQLIPEVVNTHSVDLLVMGSQGRTGIPGLTMGNTAENILHQLSCSLLAIKPAGFVSPVAR